MIEEKRLRRKYLNSGDVFILDLGLELIQVGMGYTCTCNSQVYTSVYMHVHVLGCMVSLLARQVIEYEPVICIIFYDYFSN